ncbi:MAG TPA: hypothetical protein VLH09_13560, partial [Bryobacteraceae bacterium]|nr:hypothetical protein [Bryobacteraceae bacterium]
MRAHNRRHGIWELDLLYQFGAHHGVGFHLLELLPGKFAGLGNDVFRHGHLSDVVEHRRGIQRLQFGVAPPQFPAQGQCVDLDARQVVMRVLVLRLD